MLAFAIFIFISFILLLFGETSYPTIEINIGRKTSSNPLTLSFLGLTIRTGVDYCGPFTHISLDRKPASAASAAAGLVLLPMAFCHYRKPKRGFDVIASENPEIGTGLNKDR